MGNPTLIQALNEAGIANAENYRLASGISLLAGEIIEMDGVRGVPISDDQDHVSRFVPLSDISSIIQRDTTTFTSPSVFRSSSVSACSSTTSSVSHDYSLDQSVNPINPDGSINVDSIEILLRQIASGDRDQAAAGKESLDYARDEASRNGTEEEFNVSLEAAKREVAAEHPEEAASIERSCQQYQQGTYRVPQTSTLPESSAPRSGSSDSGASGTGTQGADGVAGTVAVASQGVVVGDSGGGTEPVLHIASNHVGVPAVLNESDSPTPSLVAVRPENNDDPYDVPAPVCPPVTVTISNATLPALIGISVIPGNGPQLFQNLFGLVEIASSSPIVQSLTSSDSRLWLFQEATRDAVSGVLRSFLGDSSSPSGQRGLNFGANPRGLEISPAPAREPSHSQSFPDFGVRVRDDGRPVDEEASGFSGLRSSFHQSLALFRIGVDGIRRAADSMTGIVTAFVPFLPPSQYMFARHEARPAVGGLIHDSHATDRAPAKISPRGDSPDGDHGGEGGERGSRGGRGGHQEPDDQEQYAQAEEDEIDFPDSLSVDSSPWQHSQRKNAA